MATPATVKVYEMYGAGPSYNGPISDRVRLFNADLATTQGAPQSTNPVVIPSTGTPNYSFWKAVCLHLTMVDTTINNIRHYSNGDIDWTMGTGGMLQRGNRDAGDIGCPIANYAQGITRDANSGVPIDDAVAGHAYYKSQTTPVANVNLDLVGSPPVVDSDSYIATGYTKAVVLQVKVYSDAVQGLQTSKTLTWKYDEA